MFHFDDWEHFLRFDPGACEPFFRLFDTDVCLHLAAVELWVASVLLGLFHLPEYFFHDVFALHDGDEAFVGVALFSHRQVLFGFVHTASEDGVIDYTREILPFIAVRFCFKQTVRRKLYSQNVQLWLRNVDSERAHAHNVWFVLGLQSSIKNREGVTLSTLAVGRGKFIACWRCCISLIIYFIIAKFGSGSQHLLQPDRQTLEYGDYQKQNNMYLGQL